MQTGELSAELSAVLGEDLCAFVADQVKAGHYRDEAEVLRAALALLETSETTGPGLADAEIRALVEDGDASGEAEEDLDSFFDRLEAKYAAMANRHRDGA